MSRKCHNLNYLQIYHNKPFIYERKSLNKETIYCYKTVIQETNRCLEYFQKYQIKNNVGIAIDIREHSAATCILLLGILNHECHFYCLDFEETKDLRTYIRLSAAQYLISPNILKSEDIFKTSIGEIEVLEETYYLYSLNSENKTFQNASLCYTIATSGSTGQPKMVHVPYECIEPNIKALSSLLSIDENDIVFLGSPATFDPFVVELFVALEKGAGILIISKEIRLQSQELLKLLFPDEPTSLQGVTIYQTTPSLFRLFGPQNIQNVILNNKSSLRCLILGGEAFPSSPELKTWLPLDFSTCNKRIFNIYGITEVSCWSSIYEINTKNISDEIEIFPLGKPLDDFTFFRVVDEFGNVLHHKDCKGELEIGSSIRKCYIPQYDDIKILELNNIIYRKTGDLVKRDGIEDIFYIRRTNNTIKRLGKRLSLDSLNKTVENHLNSVKKLCKAIFLWDNESNKLILYLVNEKNVNIKDRPSIVNRLKENLEDYEQPDRILYGNELPLNRHGKVDNKKILEMLLTKQKSNDSPVKIFKDFLTNVMGLQFYDNEVELTTSVKRLKFSLDISFTKVGGTSFQALSLATEIAEVIKDNNEQRKILEMFLDNNVTIEEILQFLKLATRKLDNNSCENVYLETANSNYDLKLLWRCDLKKCIDSTPTIYQEKFVAVGSHSHLLLTVNALTGEEISCLELNDRIECSVVFVSSHLALVGCYDGFLYGFDFNNGNIMWTLNAKGMIKAKPLVVKNLIIIASYAEDYNIVAFDLKTLILKWFLKLGSKGIFSTPLQIAEDSVLFCNLDGTYALLEAETGTIKWLQKLDSPIFSTAAKIQIKNETLLVLAEVKGLISLCHAENGKKISNFQTEGNVFSGLTLHHLDNTNHTLIIFGCHDKSIYCLNLEHTSKQFSLSWKYSLNSAVYSTPILISKRYILACSTKGLLVLLDVVNANILTSYDIKAEVFSTATCLNDKFIYVGSRDNHLYAFELEK